MQNQKVTLTIVRSKQLFQKAEKKEKQNDPVTREAWYINVTEASNLKVITTADIQQAAEELGHFRGAEEAYFAALYTLVQKPLVDRQDVLLDGSEISEEHLTWLFQALRNTADWLDLDKEESGNDQVLSFFKTRKGIRRIMREE